MFPHEPNVPGSIAERLRTSGIGLCIELLLCPHCSSLGEGMSTNGTGDFCTSLRFFIVQTGRYFELSNFFEKVPFLSKNSPLGTSPCRDLHFIIE